MVVAPHHPAEVSDPEIPSPPIVAWRTRHLAGFAVVAGLVLLGLTLVASQTDPNVVDLAATRWLQQFQNPAFASLMTWVSWFGFAPQSWVMPLVVAALFTVRKLWPEAVWVLGTQAASLVAIGIKDLVHRARPSGDLVGVVSRLDSPSFPSGHVVQYTMLFGFTFFLVYVLTHPSMLRTLALMLLALPVILVGPSRLYLGQHWLSDVLGGYVVAAMLLIPYCLAYSKWRIGVRREPA
jgi:membrane-associated phospholipid phosphatase